MEGSPVRKDPVCGMDVDPRDALHTSSFKGRPYFFCSAACCRAFDADPEKYLAEKSVLEV